MSAPLNVLILEDNDSDVKLVTYALEQGGYAISVTRAGCRREFEEAVGPHLDVILADYGLPDYDALRALAFLEEQALAVPLIVVTGVLGEERAAECVRLGCSDYVLKDHLTRLPAAVSQAVERKRMREQKLAAERLLQQSERRFRALVENATEAVRLLDRDARVLQSFGPRVLGYAPEETVGWTWYEMCHPDDVPRVRETLDGLLREPRGVRVLELRALHRSGVVAWLDCHFVNLLDEPAVEAVVVTFRDVTERRHMVEDLEATRESLRGKTALLGSINLAMAAYLSSTNWQQAQAMLLLDARRLSGSLHGFSVMADDGTAPRVALQAESTEASEAIRSDALQELFQEVERTRRAFVCTPPCAYGLCLHPPGNLSAVPILLGTEMLGLLGVSGRVDAYSDADRLLLEVLGQTLGIIYNSHRRALRHDLVERELRQSQKMEAVGRLAGGVAHDFNNLLTAIIGFGEMALQAVPAEGPIAGYLRDVLDAAERAASLTRQLLAFSRRQVIVPERLALGDALANLARILARVIGEDIRLEIRAEAGLREVVMDPGQLEQVVMNLAVNARDAMPHGGRLTLAARNVAIDERFAETHPDTRAGAYVQLSVEDTGCGMSTEVLAHLFEPFFTTKEAGRGTGLGLCTVYGIVKQAGGDIRVESKPGRGARFDVLLPAAAPQALLRQVVTAQGDVEGHAETVLVVEDNEAVRRMARLILQEHGYRVLDAAGGAAALDLLRAHAGPVHLLMADVVLPGMTGREVADAVARSRPETRILFMSGYTDDALVRAGVQWHEVPFLQKPFTQSSLLRKVREVLDRPLVEAGGGR